MNCIQAQKHLETLYTRYRKQKFGWKNATSTVLNQKYIMDQMEETVLIFTMQNLNISEDWSNSKVLNPLTLAPDSDDEKKAMKHN